MLFQSATFEVIMSDRKKVLKIPIMLMIFTLFRNTFPFITSSFVF